MEVQPDKQNIDSVFSNTTYRIDFYQREYRWTEEQVKRLLDDIFFRFREGYRDRKHLDPSLAAVSDYPWYYLNTYVTNRVGGHVYVVDGQQRLTTLSLILTKLFRMGKSLESGLDDWIGIKIAGRTGFGKQFWMNHVGSEAVQQALYDGKEPPIDDTVGITAQNMIKNYKTISGWLEKELADKHTFETFVFYFLHRLVLIDLGVEQTDVPMLFEAINDRGMRLRPHEILKGKLLGQIDKRELERDGYDKLWERQASFINSYDEDGLDEFFQFYLKAKFADTRPAGRRFDGDYHREMFNQEMDRRLGLSHAPQKVKAFLKGDFSYFSDLYGKLLSPYSEEHLELQHLYYCGLLNIDAPFHLVLSGCRKHDPDEEEKIRTIVYEVDRYFSLLQLQNAYNSNDFQDSLYKISKDIRGKPASSYRSVFDSQLRSAIAESRNIENARDVEPLSYTSFRQVGVNLDRAL